MDQSSEGVFFVACFLVRISSTAFSRVSCCQRCLMICCCNWDIRFVVYRSSQFMSGEGMNLSGNLEMIENSMSSALLWRFEKNSLDLLWSLISISIWINSLQKQYKWYKNYLQVIWSNSKMLFKKSPDFVHNQFDRKNSLKCWEICSQKKITFSLTIWYLNGEIMIDKDV